MMNSSEEEAEQEREKEERRMKMYMPKLKEEYFDILNIEDYYNYQEIWLIPDKLRVQIYETGHGKCPSMGAYINLRKHVYLDKVDRFTAEKVVYIYGYEDTVPGVQMCSHFFRKGAKLAIFMHYTLAYGEEGCGKIPPKTDIYMEIEVVNMNPYSSGEYHLEAVKYLDVLYAVIRRADKLFAHGRLPQALKLYKDIEYRLANYSEYNIQRDILGAQYSWPRVRNYLPPDQKAIRKEITRKILASLQPLRIKYVEMLLVAKEYYEAIKFINKLFKDPKLALNERLLRCRVRAFAEIGEFDLAEKDLAILEDEKNLSEDRLRACWAKVSQLKEHYHDMYTHIQGIGDRPVVSIDKKMQNDNDDSDVDLDDLKRQLNSLIGNAPRSYQSIPKSKHYLGEEVLERERKDKLESYRHNQNKSPKGDQSTNIGFVNILRPHSLGKNKDNQNRDKDDSDIESEEYKKNFDLDQLD